MLKDEVSELFEAVNEGCRGKKYNLNKSHLISNQLKKINQRSMVSTKIGSVNNSFTTENLLNLEISRISQNRSFASLKYA